MRIAIASLAGAVLALGCGNSSTPGGGSDGGGGSTVVVRLGAAGESCTRTGDCSGDLICIAQTCMAAGSTAPVTPAPRLSARGETCTVSADCGTGLVCWPVIPVIGMSSPVFIGECDYANFGLQATGKTCDAECLTSADCLEIPIPDQPGTLPDGGATVFRSCQDLDKARGGVQCDPAGPNQRECFLIRAYCGDSSNNPWTCTNGACVYTASCSKSNEVVGGCPSYTRSGRVLNGTCNSAGRCADAIPSGCTSDISCDGRAVADDITDTCSTGECVCHAASGLCYRRCKNNLECAQGNACGPNHYCVASANCDTDAFCATKLSAENAKCVAGACKLPCENDLHCNMPGMLLGNPYFNGQVCHAGYCESIGCSSNSECSASSGGLKVNMFCTTPPDGGVGADHPISAITN